MGKKWWTPLLLPFLLTASPAPADLFQDQIGKSFPGFVIMHPAEFDSDVRDNLESNPAFLVGYFNQDDFEDFAALIRTTTARRYVTQRLLSDYYEIRLVVCHGMGGKKYRCKELLADVTIPPEYRYLTKHPPGKTECRSGDGGYIQAKTDFIGWASTKSWATGAGETQFFWQPDGSFRRCGS
ncbi:MAG: hypothetical protein AB1560_09665 [Pseudomonadota bacterium]